MQSKLNTSAGFFCIGNSLSSSLQRWCQGTEKIFRAIYLLWSLPLDFTWTCQAFEEKGAIMIVFRAQESNMLKIEPRLSRSTQTPLPMVDRSNALTDSKQDGAWNSQRLTCCLRALATGRGASSHFPSFRYRRRQSPAPSSSTETWCVAAAQKPCLARLPHRFLVNFRLSNLNMCKALMSMHNTCWRKRR